MELTIDFDEAAFRHGMTRENIIWALKNHLVDAPLIESDSDDYLAIGFDTSGNLLEVIYEDLGGDVVRVYHAMPCRKKFYDKLIGQGRAAMRSGE
jgi:hypothetical protein